MLKAKTNHGDLIFGITEDNVRLLKEGKPIKINLGEMGLEEKTIIIFYSETENGLRDYVKEFIDPMRTIMHDYKAPDN